MDKKYCDICDKQLIKLEDYYTGKLDNDGILATPQYHAEKVVDICKECMQKLGLIK